VVICVRKIFFLSAALLFLDQLIKGLFAYFLEFGKSYEIINGFLNITLVKNTGAAFSMFSQNTIFLILFTIVCLLAIYHFIIKKSKLNKFECITYGVLFGGILGNFTDRVLNGYVIDYLHFIIGNYDFPIFNFADICIVVSVTLIIIDTFRREK